MVEVIGLREPNLAAVVTGSEVAKPARGTLRDSGAVERQNIAGSSLFRSGTAQINGVGEYTLELLANRLRNGASYSELVILGHASAASRDAQQLSQKQAEAVLGFLVLGEGEVVEELLRDLGKVSAAHLVVGLEEDLAQLRLAQGVVLEVEAVEAVKRVMGVHVQRIYRQVICG